MIDSFFVVQAIRIRMGSEFAHSTHLHGSSCPTWFENLVPRSCLDGIQIGPCRACGACRDMSLVLDSRPRSGRGQALRGNDRVESVSISCKSVPKKVSSAFICGSLCPVFSRQQFPVFLLDAGTAAVYDVYATKRLRSRQEAVNGKMANRTSKTVDDSGPPNRGKSNTEVRRRPEFADERRFGFILCAVAKNRTSRALLMSWAARDDKQSQFAGPRLPGRYLPPAQREAWPSESRAGDRLSCALRSSRGPRDRRWGPTCWACGGRYGEQSQFAEAEMNAKCFSGRWLGRNGRFRATGKQRQILLPSRWGARPSPEGRWGGAALWYDPVALLIPKGKRNREHKPYLTSKAILRLLDQFGERRNGRKLLFGK